MYLPRVTTCINPPLTILCHMEEPSVCRICYDGASAERPLISPCKCKGSMLFVHYECLRGERRCTVCKSAHQRVTRDVQENPDELIMLGEDDPLWEAWDHVPPNIARLREQLIEFRDANPARANLRGIVVGPRDRGVRAGEILFGMIGERDDAPRQRRPAPIPPPLAHVMDVGELHARMHARHREIFADVRMVRADPDAFRRRPVHAGPDYNLGMGVASFHLFIFLFSVTTYMISTLDLVDRPFNVGDVPLGLILLNVPLVFLDLLFFRLFFKTRNVHEPAQLR